MMRPSLRSFAALAMTASLAACGTLDRPEAGLRMTDPTSPVTMEMARASADVRITNFMQEFGALTAHGGSTKVLALSGGGANGAYGAGMLVGWSESGNRPVFDVVTGISTGALAAPFAYLGKAWDAELRDAFTNPQTESLIGFRSFAAAFNPSLFSSKKLEALVESYVTPELLGAIATEHAKGRRLLVATTNLDTQQTVIWDMGAIATRGDEGARKLFKDVLVASASIPGVFPPVLIPGLSETGQPFTEMHVDGGVNVPYLAIPEELMLWTSPRRGLSEAELFIIVNGQTGRNTGTTRGSLAGILGRTYDSMSKASLRTHLAVTSGFARRNGIEMFFSAIPDNVQASALSFEQEAMTALFEMARKRGLEGTAWRRLDEEDPSKDFVPADELPEADIPVELSVPTPTTDTPTEPTQKDDPNG